MPDTDNIVNSLMNHLYTILTDGEDGFVQRNEQERFITWCLPGIPFDPEELRFAHRGIVGQGNTPEAKAEDTAMLIGQASRFARLVDFVPDVTGIFDEKQQLVAFHRNESALSRLYERVLKQSEVAQTELTEKQTERMNHFRNLLYPEKESEDLVTGEVQTQRVEGPIMRLYKEHMTRFETAFFDYNDARIKALAAATQQDVLSFSLNGPALRRRVSNAEGEWDVAGHKNDVERIQAFIDQVTLRDLTLWKADLLDRFENSKLVDSLGQEFYFTTLIPGNFAGSDQGWSKFKFTEKDVEKHSKSKSTQFNVDGKLGWGKLSIGGSASGSTEKKHEVEKATNFEMSFSIAQIPLSRAWYDPTFIESQAWWLSPTAVDLSALSDGGIPPQGIMVAYPTSVIFARDIHVNFNEMHDEKTELHKQLSAKRGGGYGPFKIGGSYSRDEQEKDVKYTFNEEGLTVEGLQIIGFRCHLLNKAPNPHPNIEAFV